MIVACLFRTQGMYMNVVYCIPSNLLILTSQTNTTEFKLLQVMKRVWISPFLCIFVPIPLSSENRGDR